MFRFGVYSITLQSFGGLWRLAASVYERKTKIETENLKIEARDLKLATTFDFRISIRVAHGHIMQI